MMSSGKALGWFTLAVALVAVIGFAAYRWGMSSAAPEFSPDRAASTSTAVVKPAPPPDDYVGSAVCAECHAAISEKFARHPMSRSMSLVAETPEPHEDYGQGASYTREARDYRVARDGDRVWHHESVSDDEGVIYDQSEEIQYALGSGTHGRSYVMWREGGLYLSPISWYADRGWDLSPQRREWRFSRRIHDECLQCHTGRATELPGQASLFPQPVFHEIAIGCERCHGPGQKHVDYQRAPGAGGDDPIVNPADLPQAERDAVCYQCHFQAELRILRYGRKDADFRPGQKLSDIWLYLVKGNQTEGGVTQAVSQALQMQSSRCFLGSEGRLSCTSCHDPHTVPDPKELDAFYEAKCMKCHAERGCSLAEEQQRAEPANGSCIRCHMPDLPTKDVPHASQSDHRILRQPDQALASTAPQALDIYQEPGANVPPNALDRARSLMLAESARMSGDQRQAHACLAGLNKSLSEMPDDEAVLEALGVAYRLLDRVDESEDCWQRILDQNPRQETALLELANLAHDHGMYPESRDFFARLMKVHAWKAPLHARFANVLAHLHQSQEALEQGKLALEIDPSMLRLYNWLAQSYAQLGDQEQAARYHRLGRRLESRLGR